MSENSKENSVKKFDIPSIQRYLFYALTFILPLAIVPLSWDWNERPMSLCILLFSTLIVGFEVVKLIWYGKISILKTTLDMGILFLITSFLLSTIFSKDIHSSLWGIDERLSGGIIVFITIILLSITSRSFLTDIKHIKSVLFSLLIGTTICNILSIFTFLGVNIWEAIPSYKNFFHAGLPLMKLTKAHLLTNIFTLVLSFGFIGEYFISKSKKRIAVIALLSSIIAIVNILMFSMVQGLWIVITFLIIFVIYNILIVKNLKFQSKTWKSILLLFLLMTICISIPFALLQIRDIRNKIIPENINLVGQVFLGQDASWKIASSMFVNSVKSAMIGLGTDTYSIAYNMFKPLSPILISHNNVTFYNAGNELFTQLTNGGMFWFACWIYLGFLIFKNFVFDIKNIRLYKDKRNLWYLMLTSLLIVIIYVSSITAVYSILNTFILISLFSIHTVIRNILLKDTNDKFVFKLWAMDSKNVASNEMQNISVFLSILVGLVVVGVGKVWVTKSFADYYVLKAESILSEEVKRTVDGIDGVSEQVIDDVLGKYVKASMFDEKNPLYKRRLSMLYLENTKIKAKKYLSADEKNRDSKLYEEINRAKNYAIDYSQKSLDISSNVYANWENNINVHMGLIGIGYKDSILDATKSLDQAILLNPLNYELYYGKAQLHVLNNEIDEALTVLSQGISINPEHIPSLMLSAELNNRKGNTNVYESYLRAIQKILEIRQKTNSDTYKEILKKIEELADRKKGD